MYCRIPVDIVSPSPTVSEVLALKYPESGVLYFDEFRRAVVRYMDAHEVTPRKADGFLKLQKNHVISSTSSVICLYVGTPSILCRQKLITMPNGQRSIGTEVPGKRSPLL